MYCYHSALNRNKHPCFHFSEKETSLIMTMNPRVQCLHSFESNVCRHWQVAIKVIDTKKIKDDYIRNNLHREARVLSQLRHPNIVRLFETLKVRLTSLNLRILYDRYSINSRYNRRPTVTVKQYN